ncbi:hypothetical protein HHL17_15675 [Chitinophaga sp. G-6-1-13]|uniref:GlcNAc-PI de-N-acetylase n=1 Tax=Chitinophaga fulva TaxID=2728842 RepID=A0A848GL50_9BACT|nr:hypothetical protein [Chitinophaga fulva]NML38647.1 hypothetical protein [Chitinophaga fulva]
MEQSTKNVALVIAHPGHELRVFRFVELYKPRVYVLTDGGGAAGKSRLHNTKAILEKCGATLSPVMGYYTDKEIYRVILEKDYASLLNLGKKILQDFEANNIQMVAGDAIEGYNPSHDLCRYLINRIVLLKEKEGVKLSNFDFLLDGLMDKSNGDLTIQLDDLDFERKRKAAEGYAELAFELESAIRRYGAQPFMTEYLRKVEDPYVLTSWENSVPFYEQYAMEKVKKGVYGKAISFHEHLLPMAQYLITDLYGVPT